MSLKLCCYSSGWMQNPSSRQRWCCLLVSFFFFLRLSFWISVLKTFCLAPFIPKCRWNKWLWSCCDGLCCYQHVTVSTVSLWGWNMDSCCVLRKVLAGGKWPCAPPNHLLCWNLKVCIYFPVSTELWERVSFEKPSRSKLSSPRRDTGMTQAVRDSFPFVGNLCPENLPIFHKTVWELGGEKGPVRMLLFPERGCRSVACWVIPTALYRAFLGFLLNMMFLEWKRKEVFFLFHRLPHPKSALLTLF